MDGRREEMKAERISIKTMFLLMGTGAAASMLTIEIGRAHV